MLAAATSSFSGAAAADAVRPPRCRRSEKQLQKRLWGSSKILWGSTRSHWKPQLLLLASVEVRWEQVGHPWGAAPGTLPPKAAASVCLMDRLAILQVCSQDSSNKLTVEESVLQQTVESVSED